MCVHSIWVAEAIVVVVLFAFFYIPIEVYLIQGVLGDKDGAINFYVVYYGVFSYFFSAVDSCS